MVNIASISVFRNKINGVFTNAPDKPSSKPLRNIRRLRVVISKRPLCVTPTKYFTEVENVQLLSYPSRGGMAGIVESKPTQPRPFPVLESNSGYNRGVRVNVLLFCEGI